MLSLDDFDGLYADAIRLAEDTKEAEDADEDDTEKGEDEQDEDEADDEEGRRADDEDEPAKGRVHYIFLGKSLD